MERVDIIRLVNAAEVVAITLAHVGASWIALHYNQTRANYLLDHIGPKMEWHMQRYTQWQQDPL